MSLDRGPVPHSFLETVNNKIRDYSKQQSTAQEKNDARCKLAF